MSENTRTDATLPSVFVRLSASRARRGLVITIAFHPDTSRIGETWTVPDTGTRRLVLGREQPAFSRAEAAVAEPLHDPHVSRRALALKRRPGGLVVSRLEDACRCQVDGDWLADTVNLDAGELRRGVTLQLAHSVVLLLREQLLPAQASGPEPAAVAGLYGSSFYMQALRGQIARAAESDLDVLVRGETGSGKELVARAVHAGSTRASGPLVAVNMAAIPVGVAPALLFGSVRGAFTGAERNSTGYFQQADGGSLFLDEIGDTPDEVQPQLLRALQEREVQPVGGKLQRVDVRVISATDAALEGPDSNFRSALRHRLGSAEIHVAPLREHPEDIGELLCHLLTVACDSAGCDPLLPPPPADSLLVAQWAELFHCCQRYAWPGNIRELANCARQVVLDSNRGIALPEFLLQQIAGEVAEPAASPENTPVELGDDALRALLAQERYEVAAAARRTGISRQALYRRLPDLGLRLAGQVPVAELQQALAASGGDLGKTAMVLRVSRAALRTRLRNAGLPGAAAVGLTHGD